MTNAHDMIAAKRAALTARKVAHAAEGHAIELEEAELGGMEKVAHLFGPAPRAVRSTVLASPAVGYSSGESRKSNGRQRGAISQRWRRVLEYAVLTDDEWLPASRFVEIIKDLENRHTTPPQIRRILDGYAANGFVQSNEFGFYRVTETARNRFGLAEPSAHDALNENGAGDTASDDRDEGVPAPSHPNFDL
jgi:hypothetical protein